MIKRTFISKTNTIYKDNEENYGLFPACKLNYGAEISRVMVYFDTDSLKEMYANGEFPIYNSLTHTLHMYNYGPINNESYAEPVDYNTKRATSFNIIIFRIPKEWDRGIGFDVSSNIWMTGRSAVSYESSNWYRAKNGIKWEEEGIYSNETLAVEYEKYVNGEASLVVGEKHFDYGNENLDVDITEFVNNVIKGNYKNHGLCLAFVPYLESEEDKIAHYVAFFGDKTNTFFKPYVTTKYNEKISDDREFFPLNRKNRLYFYVQRDGEYMDLDEMPVCKVDGTEYEVVKQFKGIYYANIKLSSKEYEKDMILVDEWSNIKLDGEELEDVEMEFVTLPSKLSFTASNKPVQGRKIAVTVSGSNTDEKFVQGQEKAFSVDFVIPYEKKIIRKPTNAYYRIYVMDGDREKIVIDWDHINTAFKYNYFKINTSEFLPKEYHVDIKVDNNGEITLFKDELRFKIVGDTTNETR